MSDYLYDAVVKRVVDGDTVVVDWDLGRKVWIHNQMIRLHGINAPELNTQAGQVAKAFLMSLLSVGTMVVLDSHKDRADKYGDRWLGTILLGDMNVNEEMIRSGHAFPWSGSGPKPSG